MMLSASPNSLARSSLEEMLDSLRRRDEEEKPPRDLPPALPARPTSKARLPSARRSLPNSFKVRSDGGNGNGQCLKVGGNEKDENKRKDNKDGGVGGGHRRKGSFGIKKMKVDVESPYIVKSEIVKSEENNLNLSSEEPSSSSSSQVQVSASGGDSAAAADTAAASVAPPASVEVELELEDDNIAYFIKKVTGDLKVVVDYLLMF